ncbi:mitochondrial fission process protein 1-like isoform X1 [Phymastichus coffea]|uniref:mitochondrial fission process protein 1-like isoform X1 n=1 Tax=Phymastichus coffea TaxID=108790 RepID=UPI00273C27AB|nr:mitochondrial fission process protein 1-like isoform X1 [Phymastichus coffea]
MIRTKYLKINIDMMTDVKQPEIDIFRDTYIRYLGYTNEVGEAFRSIVPKSVVWSSYVAACGYVFADTIHKGIHVYNEDNSSNKIKQLLLSTSDTLLWQGFASVIIPGITINRLCATVRYIQKKSNKAMLRSPWISTMIGLASIPLIIHPIDLLVENSMNRTYRKWTGYKPSEPLKST